MGSFVGAPLDPANQTVLMRGFCTREGSQGWGHWRVIALRLEGVTRLGDGQTVWAAEEEVTL